jgi:hypothetical protein
MRAWLDASCGADNWAMTRAGLRGIVNDAFAVYFADTALACWCLGYRIETYEGSFLVRNDAPSPRVAAPYYRTP